MMPDYSVEQKVAAFDALWRNCGNGLAVLERWEDRVISQDAMASIHERRPVYAFTILYNGEVETFKDVLHHLATQKETPAGEDRG